MKKILFILITIFAFSACSNEKIDNEEVKDPNENVESDLIPMIFIDDNLYLYSGDKKDYNDETDFDGEIDSEVKSSSKPYKNNQSNFGTGFKYKILDEGKTINLYHDDNKLMIFKKDPYENVEWDLIPMIFVDDKLYLYSGEEKYYDKITDFDGEIDSEVESTTKPTKNNQSNFGTGFKYKFLEDGKTINLYINDNKLIIFKTEEDRKQQIVN
ncbi:hypothetical protein [uncultured Anaerococcus sp.]|uniref:hypothetical protein n=1 Tax=uncultured Anaerococcus sp. TaxID=293428 RepID=UPI0028895059|nr:hypothetical protein [uncultured Anaerococcus sp.]